MSIHNLIPALALIVCDGECCLDQGWLNIRAYAAVRNWVKMLLNQ